MSDREADEAPRSHFDQRAAGTTQRGGRRSARPGTTIGAAVQGHSPGVSGPAASGEHLRWS
jgi:hypothetical protein